MDVPDSDRSRDIYIARVNLGIDLIMSDVGGDLSLQRIATESGFSPFHFHRIFRATTGYTLAEFVNRVRLDRARTLMGQTSDRSLTDVALACGFGSSSNFSRVFKKRFGIPPSAFDAAAYRITTEDQRAEWYRGPRTVATDPHQFTVRTVAVKPRAVAYVRVTQPYEPGRISDAARCLEDLLDKHGSERGKWIGYTWDHPDFVAAQDCTYNLCIEIAATTRPTPPINRAELPAMTLAEVTLAGNLDDEVQAIDWLYQVWLPSSGYQPTSQPILETWTANPFRDEAMENKLTIGLPVTHL